MRRPTSTLLMHLFLLLPLTSPLNLLLDLRGLALPPGDAVKTLSQSLYPDENFENCPDPFLDCLSIGGGGAIEGIDLDVGGFNSDVKAPICGVNYPVHGCVCTTANGNSVMLCGQGASNWGLDPTRALGSVHVIKEDADNDRVLRAIEGIRAGKVVVVEDGEESKTAVLDMDLLSFLLDIAQPSSIVARTVTRKSSVLPIFTKMSQENWDGKKVEKTQSGLLVPTGVEDEGGEDDGCLKALVLPYDEGIWRSCLDVLDLIRGEGKVEVGVD